MSIDILMPALSPTMEEGALARWHVKVGDTVKCGDVIAEIETDKATLEVEAVDEGVIESILVLEGTEKVQVNTSIARLRAHGETRSGPAKSEALSAAESPVKPEPGPAPKPAPDQPAEPIEPAKVEGARIFASPLARRLAQQANLSLAQLQGSGPHGRIIRRDVERQQGQRCAAPAAPAAQAPRQAPSLEQMGIPPGSYDLIPMDRMTNARALRTTDSFRNVPHFPLSVDVEIDQLLAAQGKINASLTNNGDEGGIRVGVYDMIIKAATSALMRVPEVNASYTPGGVARHRHADLAVAVAITSGLINPILRAAETKGLARIAAEIKDLAERAGSGTLTPEEVQGGTFSISNLGMFGVKSFASIINEPQGCILSVGVSEKRPVVREDQLAIATVMSITLTCDHRVVDGATGSRWLKVFKAMIEDPLEMLV